MKKSSRLKAPSQNDSILQKFFSSIINNLEPNQNSIRIGDFNTIFGDIIDGRDQGKTYQKPKTSRLINDYALENSMVDPWRTTNPQEKEFLEQY